MTDWPPEWTEAAKAWRAERDRDHPISTTDPGPPPARCEHCHPGPCRFPTFCAIAAHAPPGDRTLNGRLPNRWWKMNDLELGAWLDRRDREGVPEATFWAIHYALTRPNFSAADVFVRRYADIAGFSPQQIKEMIRLLSKANTPLNIINSFQEFVE